MRTNAPRIMLCAVALLVAGGCDEAATPPPSAGQGIKNLSESPNSLLGRSAGRARDVAKDAANYQAESAGIAAEGTGEAEAVTVSGVGVSVPRAWIKRAPSSSMRLAEYVVAPDSGKGEAVVVFFGSIGGGVQANINRWKEQVLGPDGSPVEETNTRSRTINGVKVTTVEMHGTLKGGVMGGPPKDMPGSSFLAAIIEGPGGPAFIKFTGPSDAVAQAMPAWEAMISGMRKN
ncbi:MAG: hypothetical protein ACK4WH_09485 [Phycisphaerales bacterium]